MTTDVVTGGTSSGLTAVNGDFILVSSGGVAIATIVSGGGTEDVAAGGVVSGTTVISGGHLNVSAGGQSDGAILSGGDETVLLSGAANATQVSAGGIMAVSSGGIGDFSTVSGGGIAYVFAAGQDDGTVVDSAGQEIVFGGQASGTVLNGLGIQEVTAAGAMASATIVSGEEFVFSGGVAIGSVVSSGGFDEVEDNSTVSDTTISSGGSEFVYLGGTASGSVVSSGGVEVISGGTASFVAVSRGGSIDFPDLVFASGGSAMVSGGDVVIVTEGGASAEVQLAGDNPERSFQAAVDSGGGTMITFVGAPRTLTWTSARDDNFADAANWDDTSNALNPAAAPPNATDTAEFLIGGGEIAGNGSVAALTLDSGEPWQLASGAALTVFGTAIIGGSNATNLLIYQASSLVATGTAIIANTGSASGSVVNVAGLGSVLQVADLLDVGVAGSGALEVSGGATVSVGSLGVGNVAAAVGQIGLVGANTDLVVTNAATVADDGTGVLSVLAGATFSAGSLTIGSQSDSSGVAVVSGEGSVLNVSGSLNIGTANGTGDLTVGPGAAIQAQAVFEQGQVVLEGGLLDPTVQLINQGQTAGGFGTIAAGDIVDEGAIQAGGDKGSQKLLIVRGTVLGGGTLTVDGTVPGSVPAGMMQINAGGTLELSGAVLNTAATTFTDNLTPQGTYTVNNSVIDVNFVDDAGVLLLDDIAGFGGTITTYQTGDSFVITGGTLSGLRVANNNILMVSDTGSNAGKGGIDQIIFGSAVSAAGFKIVNNNTIQAQTPCFAEGTRIATDHEPVAVERLAVGDRLLTADGSTQTIVWIGQREVNCRTHPAPETVRPVRVAAGAFGETVPARDLFLSPDHAVFVNGVLVPVKMLINGTSIARVNWDRVRYFHVELPRHAVILAEGLSVESYLDTGDRPNFRGDDAAIRLFPDFTARLAPDAATVWETRGAAPLVMAGEALTRARLLVTPHVSP